MRGMQCSICSLPFRKLKKLVLHEKTHSKKKSPLPELIVRIWRQSREVRVLIRDFVLADPFILWKIGENDVAELITGDFYVKLNEYLVGFTYGQGNNEWRIFDRFDRQGNFKWLISHLDKIMNITMPAVLVYGDCDSRRLEIAFTSAEDLLRKIARSLLEQKK